MKKLKRDCWWCSVRLMAVSHAEVKMPNGHTVWVHKGCEEETRRYFRPKTAQPVTSSARATNT